MRLRKRIKLLEQRIEVMEFKDKCKDKNFLIQFAMFPYSSYVVSFLNKSATKVIQKIVGGNNYLNYRLKENGKYLEVYSKCFDEDVFEDVLQKVYKIKNDDLVEVDLELYKKAMESEIKC